MKNGKVQLLVLVTCVFAAFILGLFAGRNHNRTPVQIRTLPATENTAVTYPTEITATEPDWPIDINTATKEMLCCLPGIGEGLAQRIIDYRETYGPFSSVGALSKVSGIGEQRLEEVWDLITVGG